MEVVIKPLFIYILFFSNLSAMSHESSQDIVVHVAQKIYISFLRNVELREKIPELNPLQLRELILKLNIDFNSQQVYDQTGIPRSAFNLPSQKMVSFYQEDFDLLLESRDYDTLILFVFHELCSLLNLERNTIFNINEVDGYKVTIKIIPFLDYIRKTTRSMSKIEFFNSFHYPHFTLPGLYALQAYSNNIGKCTLVVRKVKQTEAYAEDSSSKLVTLKFRFEIHKNQQLRKKSKNYKVELPYYYQQDRKLHHFYISQNLFFDQEIKKFNQFDSHNFLINDVRTAFRKFSHHNLINLLNKNQCFDEHR